MKTYNVGVIGCGYIAQKAHFPNIAALENLNFCAVSDLAAERAEAVKKEYNLKYAFSDYKELLALDEIDAVHICTPNYLHIPIAMEALEAGKHVLIEKPIATNVKDAEAVYKKADSLGLKVMSASCFRYVSEGTILKRFIDSGQLGEIYYVNVKALRRRGIPPHGVFTKKALQGGGPLIDIGIHQLDLAIYLLGNPKPVRVTGQTFTKIGNTPGHAWGDRGPWNHEEYDIEDFACGLVHFDNGLVMNIETSFAANIKEDTMYVSLMGTKGGANTKPLKIWTEAEQIMLDCEPHFVAPTNFYIKEIEGFYKAIEENREVPITQAESINVLKIIEGIYKSAEEQKEILL